MASFRYTPLNRQTRSIRLLRFADDAGPCLSCRMGTFELARCPPFVALSYTWGHPDLCREISVNGKQLRIRENLYLAMSMLQKMPATQVSRDHQRERRLIHRHFWIDAVCINQEDTLERGHQVNLMESIFTGATCVIAWLGIEADDSNLAINAISSQFRSRARTNLLDTPGNEDEASPSSLVALSLFRLSARSYWKRMWIVQEFILPENLLLLCGEHGAWWEDLLACKPAILKIVVPQRAWLKSWEARDRWKNPNSHYGGVDGAIASELGVGVDKAFAPGTRSAFTGANSLDELLFAFSNAKCSDPRDRVYALLSLVRDRRPHGSTSLLPDYTISAEQLYYRVLSHLRYSPSLAEHKTWSHFRAVLFLALDLNPWPNETSFHLHDALYKITGSISWQRMAASFESYEKLQYRYFLWRQGVKGYGDPESLQQFQYRHFLWKQSLKGYELLNSDTPFSSYRRLIKLFGTFPRHLDPQAWHDFDNLAKVVLGIPRLPLTEFLSSIPGVNRIIDQYSRATQAYYRDKAKWDAFSATHMAIPRQEFEAYRSAARLLVHELEQSAEFESSKNAPESLNWSAVISQTQPSSKNPDEWDYE